MTGNASSSLSDVWSFGIVVWEIFGNGDLPFSDLQTNEQVKEFVIQGKFSNQNPPEIIPHSLRPIVSQCWKMNPNERITFETIAKKLCELCPNGAGGEITTNSIYDVLVKSNPEATGVDDTYNK